ncbi:MAG: hypothetical protein HFE75_13175 [Firmicutes bacterium]|nr:hypothetical protein [Bacillota bacterium]
MIMGISGNHDANKSDYVEQMKEKRALDRAEKAEEAEKGENGAKTAEKISPRHDEYISSEKAAPESSGLYRLGEDENGERKIFFDDPSKFDDGNEKTQPKVNPDGAEKSEETCTGNTDKVDREIRKLREKKQLLEQQIQAASGDEEKVRELEKKLARVESELSQKDTDAYRRQHTTFS